MSNWMTDTLGNICDDGGGEVKTGPFGSQLHQSDYQVEGTPVVMPTDIINGKINTSKIARVSEKHVIRLKQHKLSVGDIVYGRRGDIGRQALISNTNEGWLCGTGCLRVTLKNSKVLPKYLHLYLQMSEVISWIQNQAVGATMPNLNTSILRRVPVKFPLLPIQKKIAAILSAYDELIENNNRRIAILEKMAEEIYREWFVRMRFPGHEKVKVVKGVPEGWNVKKLADVCSYISRGVTPEYEKGSGRFFINQKVNKGNRLEFKFLKEVKRGLEFPDTKLAKKGDILLNSLGEGTIGRTHHYAHANNIYGIDQHMTIIRSSSTYSPYLYMYLSSEAGQGALFSYKSGGTNMTMLNLTDVKKINVILPSSNTLEEYAVKYWALANVKLNLNNSIEDLKKSRNLLLPRIISGKLDVENLDIIFPPGIQGTDPSEGKEAEAA